MRLSVYGGCRFFRGRQCTFKRETLPANGFGLSARDFSGLLVEIG